MTCERLPFEPIEVRIAEPSVTAIARRLCAERGDVYRWRRSGLTFERADRLAVLVGHHPAELWPDDW